MEAFQSHLENTLFKTDQDNFYRVSIVISKLCEEEKIDVIGCKTKANLQPLPRRRAMTVISPGCQMSGPRCRGRRRGAHRVTLASQKRCSRLDALSGEWDLACMTRGLR